MHSPPHPGEILKEVYMSENGVSISALATALGVARKTVSAIVNERSGVSPQMALRLAKYFGNSAEFWLNLQRNYDLWQAKQTTDISGVKALGSA